MKRNNKGFTLAELLIVVAILGILVVVAIPTFRNSLDDAKRNTTRNNLRAAYSQAVVEVTKRDSSNSSGATSVSSEYPVVCKAPVADGQINGQDADLPFTIDDALSIAENDTGNVKFVFEYNAQGVQTGAQCTARALSSLYGAVTPKTGLEVAKDGTLAIDALVDGATGGSIDSLTATFGGAASDKITLAGGSLKAADDATIGVYTVTLNLLGSGESNTAVIPVSITVNVTVTDS